MAVARGPWPVARGLPCTDPAPVPLAPVPSQLANLLPGEAVLGGGHPVGHAQVAGAPHDQAAALQHVYGGAEGNSNGTTSATAATQDKNKAKHSGMESAAYNISGCPVLTAQGLISKCKC